MTTALTEDFFTLEPNTILDALQSVGFECTGRCLQLNSLENRVHEIELEEGSEYGQFVVSKFYRPLRWTAEQIEEEHQFVFELAEEDLPVVCPIAIDGESLFECPTTGMFFCVFPKFGGRNLDEFSKEQGTMLGRFLARIHSVGARTEAPSRTFLGNDSFGRKSLSYLLENNAFPADLASVLESSIERLLDLSENFWNDIAFQRIHGDAHVGNILNRDGNFHFVDFDDCANGPTVQDLWLLAPGRDSYARGILQCLLDGYQEMRDFDFRELYLIEPLRTLRVLYFSAWIHRRWEDPSFQRTFEEYGTPQYWREQLAFYSEQLEVFSEITAVGDPLKVFERNY